MTSKKSHVGYNQRRKVLNHARDLARSGEHADYQTILPQLAALEDFEAVRWVFEDRALCAQLDKLCARARNREGPLPELASRRTGVRLTRAPERESRMKRLCGGPLSQGDVEAEFAELSGEASGKTRSLGALKVIGPKIVILCPALQHVVDRRQHGGRDRHDGFAGAPARFEPLKSEHRRPRSRQVHLSASWG